MVLQRGEERLSILEVVGVALCEGAKQLGDGGGLFLVESVACFFDQCRFEMGDGLEAGGIEEGEIDAIFSEDLDGGAGDATPEGDELGLEVHDGIGEAEGRVVFPIPSAIGGFLGGVGGEAL